MIRVEELSKEFLLPGERRIVAVDRISFEVSAGEVYGLLGPNGAGKTTTLRMILGLLQPTAGYAAIAGHRSSECPDEVKRLVGLVSSSAGVYQSLTVREMLSFFADLYGVAEERMDERLEGLSDLLGLAPFFDQPCGTLSTGQKQRINLARSLVHDPPVMLLDEPTLGLDVYGSQVVTEFIEHLRSEGKAAILCTHALDEAQRLCTRFGLMHEGRLVCEGTLDELRARTACDSLVDMFLKLSKIGPALGTTPAEAPA